MKEYDDHILGHELIDLIIRQKNESVMRVFPEYAVEWIREEIDIFETRGRMY